MPTYAQRCFTVEEAAKLAGIRRGNLDVMIHRLSDGAECLFAGKQGGRRWFSIRDITVLAVARELERSGMVLLTAVATAYEHLQGPPDPDAILVVPAGTVSARSGRIIADRDVARLLVEKSQILIPIGAIAGRVFEACSEMYQNAA
ncbi:hypothetical protein NKI30_19500 [Mesorhizobium opportunistum]|uniref:hypothetical protein n=1 Tax=Mesorhizobium opportunistum TaxID=593909 RepID=UPI003338D733